MKVLDLFSGIGGFSYAMESLGARTVAFCEIDPYASKVLNKWWPHVPNFSHGIVGLNSLLRRVRTASRPGSRARISHSLARAPDLPGCVPDSFGHSCEPFAWFDPASRSWRTWQRCFIEGWEVFSGPWPRSGMTRSGIAYLRQPLVRLTKETEYGSLLPTPTASQYGSNQSASSGATVRPSLSQIARLPTPTAKANMASPSMQKWPAHRNLWPTPQAGDSKAGPPSSQNQFMLAHAVQMWPTPTASLGTKGGRVTPRKGSEGGTLIEAVSARQFATPTSRDWPCPSASPETLEKNSRPLSEQIGGSLNPTWVEWLMAYPLGWTELSVSATP